MDILAGLEALLPGRGASAYNALRNLGIIVDAPAAPLYEPEPPPAPAEPAPDNASPEGGDVL